MACLQVKSIPITSENPNTFSLSQNYPNPFNPVTKIKFETPPQPSPKERGSEVKLIVYDVTGRDIAILVNEQLPAGTYEVEWDGTNYPNPFNPITKINYEISKSSSVKLTIYNILGQEIKILINQILQPDEYQVKWDGTDNNGIKVSSGIYIYQLKTNDLIQTKNMILLR